MHRESERVPADEEACQGGLTWYLLHHGVYHHKKQTNLEWYLTAVQDTRVSH